MDLWTFAEEEARRAGLPEGLVTRVIRQESGGRANAVSPKGARGVMQLMPATARELGVDPDDPYDNIRGGVRYLKQQLDAFGTPELALAAYNAGPGNVRKYGGIPPFAETQNYVNRIMGDGDFAFTSAPAELGDGAAIFGLDAGGAAPARPQDRAQELGDGAAIFGLDKPAPAEEEPAIEIDINRSTNPEFLAAQRERRAAPDPIGAVGGFMANVNRNVPLFDEVAAGGGVLLDMITGGLRPTRDAATGDITPIDIQAAFRERMSQQRGLERDFAQNNPNAAALAQGIGLAGSVAIPGPKLMASPNMVANAGRGAVAAGLTGAGFAAADEGTASERLTAAAEAASNPIILGLGAVGGALATPRAARPQRAEVNAETLKEARNRAYAAVGETNVRYAPEAYDELATNITRDLAEARLNPMRHPKAASMLEDINSLRGSSPTLTELDQLRQVIRRDVASATDDAEKFMGRRMIDQIDDFIAATNQGMVVSGAADDASRVMLDARAANTRFRKVEAVEDAVESARLRAGSTGSGGNVDNATRQNLRRVLETTPNLTAAEREALESIVLGGRGQNVLRLLGKLSPQGNGLMAALGIGGTMMNPAVGGVALAGMGAKATADAMTQQKVARLIQMMADGGDSGVKAQEQLLMTLASDPKAQAAYADFVSRLSRAVGVAGASASEAGAAPMPPTMLDVLALPRAATPAR